MPSTLELFGDDDDSSASETGGAAGSAVDDDTEKLLKKSNSAKQNGDDDKIAAAENDPTVLLPNKEKQKLQQRRGALDDDSDDDDDDDDDDDEPQFDDQGVVGLKSTTMAGSKLNTAAAAAAVRAKANAAARSRSRERSESPTLSEPGDEQQEQEEEEAAPTISSQTLVVQELMEPLMSRRDNNANANNTKDSTIGVYYTRLPNILGIQTEAFSPDTFSADAEEEDFGQATSAHNLVRWRYTTKTGVRDNDDNDDEVALLHVQQRESNTRLVEWEDGTYTLHVGENEAFQVGLGDSSTPQGFAGLNGYLYLSQTATYKDSGSGGGTDGGDGDGDPGKKETSAGTVLECMGPVQSRLVIRPSSLQSEAHKSLTVGIRQKTIKKARIAEFVTQEDPEKLKLERIKVNVDLEKAAIRKRGGSSGGAGGNNYPRSGTGSRRMRMSREYLEEDGNYDTTNLKDMKRRTMGGDYEEMDDYGDDSDDYGDAGADDKDETFRKVRPGRGGGGGKAKPKRADKDESDEDEVFLGDEEDDEDDMAPRVKASNKKRSHQAVVDDDDSD